jgi:hypothetical protein
MRKPLPILLAGPFLAGLFLAAGCSESGKDPDAGTGTTADANLKPPGCASPCAEGQVCSGGTCVAPGPSRACGSARYGDGLPTGDVLFVDGAASGQGDGTKAKPYATIGAALAAAASAAPDAGAPSPVTIAVADGTYDESLALTHSVTLRCRCAEKVRITGPVEVDNKAGSVQVVIDGCELAPKGLAAKPPDWGACSGKDRGVRVQGEPYKDLALTVTDSVIRGWCVGVHVNVDTGSSSAVCLVRSTLLGNVKGLEVINAPPISISPPAACAGLQEAVAVDRCRLEQNKEAGLFTRSKARGVALRSSLVARSGALLLAGGKYKTAASGGFGAYLGDTSSAHIHDNLFLDNERAGLGVINSETIAGTTFDIRRNVFAGNGGAGITLQQLSASKPVQLVDNRVSGTRAATSASGGATSDGDGIQLTVRKGTSFAVKISGNEVHGSARHGVVLDGVSGSVATNTLGANKGYGVVLQQATAGESGNTYAGNGQGTVLKTQSPTVLVGAIPLPIP